MNNGVLRKLYAVCRELGVDNETLHERVSGEFGVSSLRKLNDRQGYYMIDILQGKKRTHPGDTARLTDRQMWKIRELERALGWDDNPARLKGFIKKYGGVDSIEWLSRRGAGKVIEGLKKLENRN